MRGGEASQFFDDAAELIDSPEYDRAEQLPHKEAATGISVGLKGALNENEGDQCNNDQPERLRRSETFL